MKIKTKILITIITVIAVTTVVYAASIFSKLQMDDMEKRVAIAKKIMNASFDIVILTQDFLLHPEEERPLIQWRSEHQRLSALLEAEDLKYGETDFVAREIKQKLKDVNEKFSVILRERESEQKTRATSHLLIALNEIAAKANYIFEQNIAERNRIHSNAHLIIYISTILEGIAVSVVLIFLYRNIVKNIEKLQEGTKIVAEDNLNYKINIKGNDEISSLANSFNKMVDKLRDIERVRQDFIILASHQLRTPLSGTKWLIETMKRGITGKVTKKQQNYLNQIYQINERMIKIVSEMLNTIRFESVDIVVKKEMVSIGNLYQEISAIMSSSAENRGVILRNVLEKQKAVAVETDALMLRSIIECFVSNAINYSEKGGEVILDAKEETDKVILFVKDYGIGIPGEEQKHIFERFYRASNAKKIKPEGTGLGLCTASLLAKRIGAEIFFESREGGGSAFYLRFPKNPVKLVNRSNVP